MWYNFMLLFGFISATFNHTYFEIEERVVTVSTALANRHVHRFWQAASTRRQVSGFGGFSMRVILDIGIESSGES